MEQRPFTGDELRSLITGSGSSLPSQGSSSQPRSAPTGAMTGAELRSTVQQDAEARKPKIGLGEDVLKSGAAGLGRGFIGLAGLPGDVESLGRMGLRAAGANVGASPALPTSQEIIAGASGLSPTIKGILEHKPETGPGRYVKSVGEFAPAVIGGPGSVAARAAGTVGAGVASQAAEDAFKGTSLEGTGYETAAKIAASIPGSIAGTKAAGLVHAPFSGLLTPGKEAEKRLAAEFGKDIAAGGKYGAKASPAEIAEVGSEVPVAAIAGRRTQDLVQRSAERVPEAIHGQYATAAQTRRADAPNIVIRQIDDMFGGGPVNPYDELAQLSRQAAAVNTPAYKQLYALPHAQALTSPELVQVVNRLPKGILNDVGELIRQQGTDPRSLGMVMGRGGQWVINPTQPMPMQFWDAVKRKLDVSALNLKDPMTGKLKDPTLYRATTDTVDSLKNALKPLVPEYDVVRGAAAEILGAKSAVELGMKFLNMRSADEINEVRRSVLQNPNVSADVKREFAYGVAGAYRRQLEDAPETALKMFTGKDAPGRIKMLSEALAPIGPQAGEQLVGQVLAQNFNSSIQSLRPGAGSAVGRIAPYATTGLGAFALQVGEVLAQPLLYAASGNWLAPILTGAVGGKYFNWKEARVAQRILEYSMDPAKTQQLAQLAASDPNARSFLQKLSDLGVKYGQYGAAASIGTEPPSDRPQRASGGRTGAGIAESLMRAADKAKRELAQETEALLKKPDEHIAKALEIAKQHI